MKAKLLVTQQSYFPNIILNCRFYILCKKLNNLLITSREQILQLVKLAISYSLHKIKCTFLILLLLVTLLPVKKSIIIWSEIVFVNNIIAKIKILYLIHI